MDIPSLKIGDLVAKLPIVQGGMGVGISLSGLAGAVAKEGGIGVIAAALVGMDQPDIAKNPIEANNRALRREIQRAKEISNNGVIGVNIMVVLSTFADAVRTAIEEKADLIISGAGLPLEMPKHLLALCEEKKEEFKTKLVPIVSSARVANIITKKWQSRFSYTPDAFVLEGPKAGGHLGYHKDDLTATTHDIDKTLPDLLDFTKKLEDEKGKAVPVIVGGGVYTGEDIAELIKQGVSGVQMGTRFVATNECDASLAFKEAIVNAKKEDITIIQSPVGMPGRALNGPFIEAVRAGKKHPPKCIYHCITSCDPKTTPYCIASALVNAMKGNFEKGFVFCGTNAPRVDKIVSVKELMAELQDGMKRAFSLA